MLYVLDTNVIINQSRPGDAAAGVIERWTLDDDSLAISTIVEAELLSWPGLTARGEQQLNNVNEIQLIRV